MVYAFDVPGWLESAACNAGSLEEAREIILAFNREAVSMRLATEDEITEIAENGGFIN